MSIKTIELIATPPEPHFVGDGFRVHNFIPSMYRMDMQRMDPFIMLDYNAAFVFPPSDKPKGVGVHPHRGFETVTIAYQGSVAHHDSAGGGGIIAEGDVQWMTAGSGVLHKEYHEEAFSKKGGIFQMVQLWLNLPKKHKMTSPKYQAISHQQIKKIHSEDRLSEINLIAGIHQGITGPASTFTDVNMMNVILQNKARLQLNFPIDHTTILLVIDGAVFANDELVPQDHLALFHRDGETIKIHTTQAAKILILSGAPIGEPIAANGPFVMNTRAEIAEAYQDFYAGKFGSLMD